MVTDPWTGSRRALPGRFDGEKIEQVVEVLVGNAMAHTPPGSHVVVTLERQSDGSALLTVVDDGPGVSDDLRRAVFDPFVLGDSVRASSRGIGISLTIVAQYAQLHGGWAWVEDGPEGGACFRVLLRPVPDGGVSGGTPDSPPAGGGSPGEVTPRRRAG